MTLTSKSDLCSDDTARLLAASQEAGAAVWQKPLAYAVMHPDGRVYDVYLIREEAEAICRLVRDHDAVEARVVRLGDMEAPRDDAKVELTRVRRELDVYRNTLRQREKDHQRSLDFCNRRISGLQEANAGARKGLERLRRRALRAEKKLAEIRLGARVPGSKEVG